MPGGNGGKKKGSKKKKGGATLFGGGSNNAGDARFRGLSLAPEDDGSPSDEGQDEQSSFEEEPEEETSEEEQEARVPVHEGSIFQTSSALTSQALALSLSSSDEEEDEDEDDYVAAAGFEFQMLDSKVKVTSKPEEDSDDEVSFDRTQEDDDYESAAAGAIDLTSTLGLQRYGRTKDWYIVQDGDNLEVVTRPFPAGEGTRPIDETMGEIKRTLAALSAGKFKLGDDIITVESLGRVDKTQPQVTVDVTLDRFPDIIELFASDDSVREELFGAEGMFGWTKAKTFEELSDVASLATSLKQKPDEELADKLRMNRQLVTETNVSTLRGMLLLLGQAVIHKDGYASTLAKDQPILHKTDMARIWAALRGERLLGGVSAAALVALLKDIYPPFNESANLAPMVRDLLRGTDPTWASQKPPSNVKTKRKKIAVELRRNPIMSPERWASFVEEATSELLLADLQYELPTRGAGAAPHDS